MRPPCEIVVNKILPNVRAELVKVLIHEYCMRQVDVADLFKITQASVSQYLTASRGGDELLMEMIPEIEEYARETAKGIVNRKRSSESNPNPWEPICEICKKILYNPKFCSYCKHLNQLHECGICSED